jgi:pimeloyl-ACP methyl ester carboxylesterase
VLAPVLVLAPSQSAATSVEEQRGLAREIRGARLEVPEGKGHEIYVTEAERCQEIFLDFLRNLER